MATRERIAVKKYIIRIVRSAIMFVPPCSVLKREQNKEDLRMAIDLEMSGMTHNEDNLCLLVSLRNPECR